MTLKFVGGKLIKKKNIIKQIEKAKDMEKEKEDIKELEKIQNLSIIGAVKDKNDVILPSETAKKMQKFINFKFE